MGDRRGAGGIGGPQLFPRRAPAALQLDADDMGEARLDQGARVEVAAIVAPGEWPVGRKEPGTGVLTNQRPQPRTGTPAPETRPEGDVPGAEDLPRPEGLPPVRGRTVSGDGEQVEEPAIRRTACCRERPASFPRSGRGSPSGSRLRRTDAPGRRLRGP